MDEFSPTGKEDLVTLYKIAHDWARHYQTSIAQLPTRKPEKKEASNAQYYAQL